MRINIILILVILGTIVGCRKVELPAPMMATPIFSIEATIDGINKSMTAGIDDYYLFTDSYIDEFNTPVYYGQLSDLDNCPGKCLESFTIELRNTTETESFDENLIAPGSRIYYAGLIDTALIDLVELTFENTSYSNHPVEYFWDFGNGVTSNLENPGSIIFENPDQTGVDQVVTLTLISDTGCSISTDQVVAPGGDPSIHDCPLILNVLNNGPAGFQICAQNAINEPVDVDWSYGDTTIYANCFEVPQDSITTIMASLTSLTGCEDSVIIIAQVDSITGTVSICQAGFYVSSYESVDSVIDEKGLGTVNIKYTDTNGTIYESGYVANQSGNTFEMISSEDYELNENGKTTRQFEFRFNGKLANGAGGEIEIQNAIGNWAIAVE